MQNIKIFSCPTAENFTKEICKNLNLPLGKIDAFKFKNDNNFVQLLETVREQDVFIVQTTHPPVNERIMELLITIEAVRRSSARRITVVLPYFMYSRSDKKDQPRIPVTAHLMAKLIETAGADRVLTCDLHNPAIAAYFTINCDTVTAKYLLVDYFKKKQIEDLVVVATDAGSTKKAYKYAKALNCKIAMIDKRREDNDDRAIATNVIGKVTGKNAIIFDDEVVTAGTLIEAINVLKENGVKDIYTGCTHGILPDEGIKRIRNAPIKEFVTTNTVPIPKEKITPNMTILSTASFFAEAIKRLNESLPMGDLFED